MKILKEKEKYKNKIKDILIFKYLSNESHELLYDIAEIIEYTKEEKIILEGEKSEYFYCVLEGNVVVTVNEDNEKEVYICSIGTSGIFGEAGMFLNVKRTANVVSSEKAVLLQLSRKNLLSYLKKNSEEGIKLLLLIIYNLLKKLKESNHELAFERKVDIDQDDVDSLVKELMNH